MISRKEGVINDGYRKENKEKKNDVNDRDKGVFSQDHCNVRGD